MERAGVGRFEFSPSQTLTYRNILRDTLDLVYIKSLHSDLDFLKSFWHSC